MRSPRSRLTFALVVTAALTFTVYRFGPPASTGSLPGSPDQISAVSSRPTLDVGTRQVDPKGNATSRVDRSTRLAYAQGWDGDLPPALAAFRAWTMQYQAASAPVRATLEPEGVRLAQARRSEMKRLIVVDPQRALAVTVPAAVRRILPETVLREVETRHAGRGDYALLASQPAPDGPAEERSVRRVVYLGGVTYTARPYGRREAQLTKEGASLHGIALDGEFALHESPLRLLEADEIPTQTAEPVCAACARMLEPALPDHGVNLTNQEYIEGEGRLWRVHETELDALEQRAVLAEDQSGPRVPAGSTMGNLAEAPPRAAAATTPHTVGTKQVLVIRVDFSDLPGEAVSEAGARALLDGTVKTFFEENSYGQTTLVGTASSELYRLPRTAAYYATANDTNGMHSDARAAASAHFAVSSFDRIIVVFPNLSRITGSRITFGGLGSVGGTNIWINGPGSFVTTTVSHELGHTYGLLHGNLWRVTDGNSVSAAGRTLEYGDPFDMMGSTSATGVARDARHHFSMWGKNHLGWLPDDAVTRVTRSGIYRIYRFDTRASPRTQPLALHVFRDGVRSYWVGLRQNFASGTLRANGAYVVWGHNQRLQTQLLDLTTPGTSANDAALGLGNTFNDADYGVIIKPLASGGEEPSQWLDVEVTVPSAPPNVVTAWGRLGATFYDTETGENRLPAPETNVPMGLARVRAIAAGDQHALALKSDGTVVAWGDHVTGQIDVPAGLTNVATIAAGGDHSGVVFRDGTVQLWGVATSGVTSPPAGLTDVSRLAIGRNHALALKNDGTVVAWGTNNLGQATVPAGLTDVVAIAAGSEFSLALKRDGTVSVWGLSGVRNGVPAGLAGVTAISAFGALNGGQFAVALKADGTIAAWGSNTNGQTNVPAGTNNIAAIAAGAFHTVLLRRDGTVTAFGVTGNGQLTVPPAMPRAFAIAASAAASFALTGNLFDLITQPEAQVARVGGSATFRVNAASDTAITYQWRKDGVAIPGATASSYTVAAVSPASAGNYDVILTSAGTTLTSATARLTVDTTPAPVEVSRIANLSIRTQAGSVTQPLLVGFVVGGPGTSGSKPLLVRGVGPTLIGFGVTDALTDPKLELFNGATVKLFENDNWNQGDTTVFSRVGAFALNPASRDAALYNAALASGSYSAQLSDVGGTSGIALAEIYDASTGIISATVPRLVNVSARTFSGTGTNVLIAGFAITGPSRKTVLIRAIGPTLTGFGVADVLVDPKLALFNEAQVRIQENDNWGGTPSLAAAFAAVGAFQLDSGSRDAALLVSLNPGSYTVQVGGVNDTTGVALVEIYDVP